MPIIAIDGPSGSGKGELAFRLSSYFKIQHVDSGLFFRKLSYLLMQDNAKDSIIVAKSIDFLENSKNYRTEEVANRASELATDPKIREIFKEKMIKICNNNAVVDGRDIGTVIFKDATIKFFLTADEDTRLQRRQLEYNKNNIASIIKERDERDSKRTCSPLAKASDAHLIDTTNLTIDEVFEIAKDLTEKSFSKKNS